MKIALISILLLCSSISLAALDQACLKNEAQIVAKVIDKKTDSLTYCVAKISMDSVSYFSQNELCPLYLQDIVEKGISYPLMNGHDCEVSIGKIVSGILVQEKGSIQFEY